MEWQLCKSEPKLNYWEKNLASSVWICLFKLKVSSACDYFLEFAFSLYESE